MAENVRRESLGRRPGRANFFGKAPDSPEAKVADQERNVSQSRCALQKMHLRRSATFAREHGRIRLSLYSDAVYRLPSCPPGPARAVMDSLRGEW